MPRQVTIRTYDEADRRCSYHMFNGRCNERGGWIYAIYTPEITVNAAACTRHKTIIDCYVTTWLNGAPHATVQWLQR